MDASVFENDVDIVLENFKKVLNLLIFCYEYILINIKFDLTEFETFIRNIFVKLLRENKKIFWLEYIYVISEAEEIADDFTTWWFIDIQILGINSQKIADEDVYFAFECKRLDGYSKKNIEYVDNWISRFLKWQYSKKMWLAWMIWFIQWYKKWENISNLINELKLKITGLTPYKINHTFSHSYLSKHHRKWWLPNIDIYHLLFDFT